MKPFWDGCRERKLLVQRDRETGAVPLAAEARLLEARPPRVGRGEAARGTVYTYVVGQEPFLPAFQDLLPHIMVVVELDEGPRLVGYMVECTPAADAVRDARRGGLQAADRARHAAGLAAGDAALTRPLVRPARVSVLQAKRNFRRAPSRRRRGAAPKARASLAADPPAGGARPLLMSARKEVRMYYGYGLGGVVLLVLLILLLTGRL